MSGQSFPRRFLWFFCSYNTSKICYKVIRISSINVEVLFELLAAILKRVYGHEVNNQVPHGIYPNASVASIVWTRFRLKICDRLRVFSGRLCRKDRTRVYLGRLIVSVARIFLSDRLSVSIWSSLSLPKIWSDRDDSSDRDDYLETGLKKEDADRSKRETFKLFLGAPCVAFGKNWRVSKLQLYLIEPRALLTCRSHLPFGNLMFSTAYLCMLLSFA